jgi:hypothetical protein
MSGLHRPSNLALSVSEAKADNVSHLFFDGLSSAQHQRGDEQTPEWEREVGRGCTVRLAAVPDDTPAKVLRRAMETFGAVRHVGVRSGPKGSGLRRWALITYFMRAHADAAVAGEFVVVTDRKRRAHVVVILPEAEATLHSLHIAADGAESEAGSGDDVGAGQASGDAGQAPGCASARGAASSLFRGSSACKPGTWFLARHPQAGQIRSTSFASLPPIRQDTVLSPRARVGRLKGHAQSKSARRATAQDTR